MNSDPTQPLDGAPAARVLVAGANGFTGALAAKIVWDHPRLELVAATSRSDAGKRLDALYPRYRVPLTLTELDLDDADFLDGIDAAIVAYPHGAAAPTDAALRAAGIKVVDLSADFRLRDMRHLRALVRRARRARPLRQGRLRADRDVPGGAARRRPRRDARLLPDRDRARRSRRSPNRACSARSSSPRCRAPPGYGRSSDDLVHYSSMTENAFPYKTEGHRHRPEIEQELAALGSPATGHLRAAPDPARPGRAGDLLRDADARRPRATRSSTSTRSATPTSPSSASSTGRRTCAPCGTRTNATST